VSTHHVFITPASGVGGEFPVPLAFRSEKRAHLYAEACQAIGQRTRVVPTTTRHQSSHAKEKSSKG